ncbi:MAG: hypothetical protein K0U54_07215 [Bacteroidetes bacterium]|nr:hypothetical protein [Bacteroidota bacterium]
MKNSITPQLKWGITVCTTLVIWSLILWDYFNEGVPTHYIFHSDTLPGISNWWGGLVLPLFTWMTLTVIEKRLQDPTRILKEREPINILYRGICALLFGVIISISFALELSIINYMMLALFVIALIIPLYKLEYLLGFVLGTMYSFGVVIPTVFGLLLLGMYALLYHVPRISWVLLKSKLSNNEN